MPYPYPNICAQAAPSALLGFHIAPAGVVRLYTAPYVEDMDDDGYLVSSVS